MSSKAQAHMVTSQDEAVNQDLNDQILRQILCSVEDNAQLSQRQLSRELGIALGSVNWYLKRCINKGLIKISQVPLKRYMYYLTPQGLEEKSRLTAQYLKWSLDFFRLGREEASHIFASCVQHGQTNIVLAGSSDFAEIFIMSAIDYPLQIKAIYDPAHKESKRLRTAIINHLPQENGITFIITDIMHPQNMWDDLRAHGVVPQNIIIPRLLNFRPMNDEGSATRANESKPK